MAYVVQQQGLGFFGFDDLIAGLVAAGVAIGGAVASANAEADEKAAAKRQDEINALAQSFVAQSGLPLDYATSTATQIIDQNRSGDEAGAQDFMVRAVTTWNLVNKRGVDPAAAVPIVEQVVQMLHSMPGNDPRVEAFIQKEITAGRRAVALQRALAVGAARRAAGISSGIRRVTSPDSGLVTGATGTSPLLIAAGVAVVGVAAVLYWRGRRS